MEWFEHAPSKCFPVQLMLDFRLRYYLRKMRELILISLLMFECFPQ
jgi:hypothetical protein